MGSIRGALGVHPQERVSRDIMEPAHALPLKGGEGLAQGGVILIVELGLRRGDPAVGESAVLDEDDGRVGARLAQLADERHAFLAHRGGVHVRQAIDHVRGRVYLRQIVAHRGVHPAIAGETEVDDGDVEAAAQDSGVDHAGP